MANLDEVRKVVDDYIMKRGYTYRDISLKIGRKDSYIQQYVKYGFPKRLSEVDRKKIANVLEIDENELIDEELVINANQKTKDFEQGKINDFLSLDVVTTKQNEKKDCNLIGRLILNAREMGSVIGSCSLNLRIIKQNSNAMKPMIKNQSLVVYDAGILIFDGDGIYVIKRDEVVEIKKLQKITDNQYMVGTLDAKYEKIILKSDEFEILGKAVSALNCSLL